MSKPLGRQWTRAIAIGTLVLGAAGASFAQTGLNAPPVTVRAMDAGEAAQIAQEQPQTTAAQPEQGVAVSEYLTVDIFVQDEELANVLQMLSLQSQRNIIASPQVSAAVTANLYGVTFYEALDAILSVNGYGYYEEGNFIYVVTAEELEEIRQRDRQIMGEVITLNYLNANDAAEFVSPLLSEIGQIKTNGDAGDFDLPDDDPTGNEEFALSSTLVIYDYAEHIAEIKSLLGQLDTRPAQVLVEATILQSALTEANAFGIDFAILSDLDFTDFAGLGGPLGAANALLNGGANQVAPLDNQGTAAVGSAGNTSGPASFKLGIINDDFSIFLRALDQVSDVTILSNPKVLALNRQPARVLVGRKIGFLNTTSTETATTQTVEFLDTGTQLAFRPFISNDGNIRMELKPRVSEGVIREATDATNAVVTIPDEITQEITTNVIVPDGSTIVLGGLFRESTSLTRTQVPVLGDIPLLGMAFRGHEDDTDRQEIIFMIKPTIVNDATLVEQGDRSLAYAEELRVGTRQGLLPFSTRRQTSQLNAKAQELIDEGREGAALWKLRQSLEMNPNQPSAIRLLEELTGEQTIVPSVSVLEMIVNDEIEARYEEVSEMTQPWRDELEEQRLRNAIVAADRAAVESYEAEKAEVRLAEIEAERGSPAANTTVSIESTSNDDAFSTFDDEIDEWTSMFLGLTGDFEFVSSEESSPMDAGAEAMFDETGDSPAIEVAETAPAVAEPGQIIGQPGGVPMSLSDLLSQLAGEPVSTDESEATLTNVEIEEDDAP